MNISQLAIKRPLLITCIIILLLVMGLISINRLGVDLFPPIDFPVVTVTTIYPGATPEEIEKLISKPLEDQISTIAGIKRLSSKNMESVSTVIAEFTYETDVKYAEQKMREKVALARNNLPDDLLDEPIVRQFDFTDIPVITIALISDLPPTEAYDLAKETIKPMLEQASGVGEVRISGGSKREIRVELDRNRLKAYEFSVIDVVSRLRNYGANISIGKYDKGSTSKLYRTISEFTDINQIKKASVSFSGDVGGSNTIDKFGTVIDAAEDQKTIAELYYPTEEQKSEPGFFKKLFSKKDRKPVKREVKPCLIMDVFKQSGENSVAVVDGVMKKMTSVNEVVNGKKGNPRLVFVYDTAKMIRRNIDDVKETMLIGIFLAFLVVYLFLGNMRSTIITGIAIPDSILGAFFIMYIFGFTINMMTLLALSLTIGLLVDDAIVVRENIFRKLESGMHPIKAAERGTKEVMLAVIATTLTIIAVFLPIGFLQGIVGRFFKQFGLTVVFAMAISLFDALTVAPLLSAYFAGTGGKANNFVVRTFDRFQDWLDKVYGRVIQFSLDHPLIIIAVTLLVFLSSLKACGAVKKTFQPDPDEGEYMVNIKMPPETSLAGTYTVIKKISDKLIKNIPELNLMTIQAGTDLDEHNKGMLGVFMVPRTERKKTTNELKQEIRALLAEFKYAEPTVDFYTRVSGGGTNKPYILNLQGDDLNQLYSLAQKIIIELKKVPDLTEITTSYEAGKPEFQIIMDGQKMIMFDVAPKTAGAELRYQVEGAIAGKFHDKGLEYNVRVRLKPEQRELHQTYNETKVPNMMNPSKLIPLKAIADGVDTLGLSTITRQNRTRVIQIFANISPGGAIGTAIDRTKELLSGPLPLPKGISYSFVGQADAYQDMVTNILIAFVLSLIFIYLVLTSLYESFFTPITIYLALPPAMSGAFFALYITGKNLDMFSMIGCIMLLGLVTKNSILLVDFALEGVRSGLSRKEAITKAGLIRLRPILMTTFAMIAGTLPVAFGVGEAAKYRTGMGVGIIGGLVLSTLITLIMVPAVFEYIDRFREFIESKFRPEPEQDSCLGKAEECEIAESMHSNKVEKMFHMADAGPEKKKPGVKKKK